MLRPEILNKAEAPGRNGCANRSTRPTNNGQKVWSGYAPWTEFATLDDSSYVVEFVRTVSRGKERFLLLFRKDEGGLI